MMNNETQNYRLTPHYVPVVTSNIPTTVRMYDSPNNIIQENLLELSSPEEDHDDNKQIATTSLPIRTESVQNLRPKQSLDTKSQYSFELPIFSPQVMRAFETNNIESEWATLINELALWIFSIRSTPLVKGEYQAIGKTLYQHYPGIAKDGFRPWSYLCRCLTQKMRRLGRKHSRT